MYVTFSWSYACQPMMAHWYNITTYCILYIQYWSTCHTRIYGSWMCGERQESNTRPQEHSVVVNAAILLFLQKYRFFFQWFAMSAYDCQSIFAWAMRVALAWSSVGAPVIDEFLQQQIVPKLLFCLCVDRLGWRDSPDHNFQLPIAVVPLVLVVVVNVKNVVSGSYLPHIAGHTNTF